MNFLTVLSNIDIIVDIIKVLVEARENFIKARRPSSDGGKKVTKEEWKEIIEDAWRKDGPSDSGLKPLVIKLVRNL